MLIDATELRDGQEIDTDVCVVGGGLAGLSIASSFLDSELKVVLLESGPVGCSSEADALSEGEVTAHAYFPLSEAAPRRLGGAAEVWGGWCRPLDSVDFERGDGRWSGWPWNAAELAPYYERSIEFLGMSDRGFTGQDWSEGLPPLYQHLQENSLLQIGVWQESPLAPVSETWADRLQQSNNITTYLGATALQIELGTDEGEVTAISAAAVNGKRFTVKARHFVLAGGALGTVRLMLASDSRAKEGVGNQNGMVGRFFAEHPHIVAGRIALSSEAGRRRPRFAAIDRGLTGLRARIEMERPAAGIRAGIHLDEDVRRREGLLNVIAHLRPPSLEPPRSALEFFREARHRNLGKALRLVPQLIREFPAVVQVVYRRLLKRPRELELYVQVETSPYPDSRVALSDQKDAFGMPRADLQWKIDPADKDNLRRTLQLMADELSALGLGRLELEPWVTEPGDVWADEAFGGLHLMGVTRMSVDPEDGVVDPDGKVHGLSNLWVAGSSVFPTFGAANPGMTLVATSLRTADRLGEELAGS
ncbi:MAG: GMC oxidoreductase [Acidimicrobiia bacterium]